MADCLLTIHNAPVLSLMDCNCGCFGVAASSKIPVKRYNLLVPDIFPKKSPPLAATVDASTERKYKKLFEYVQNNLHRGPKVLSMSQLCSMR